MTTQDGGWDREGLQWPPILGVDGKWVWDGRCWRPAPAVAHKWRWDGTSWVRREWFEGRKLLVWLFCIWIFLLVAWIPSVYVALGAVFDDDEPMRWAAELAVATVVLAPLATLGFGAYLGFHRQWAYLGWSLLFGTMATGLTVLLTFENSVPANAPDDPGLGIGAMLVTAALLPVVAGVLWLGGAVGLLARRLTIHLGLDA
jgi:hypothetical protein